MDTHNLQENDVLIYNLLYNTENGLNRGFTKKLGYITLRGDANETFFSYGFEKNV